MTGGRKSVSAALGVLVPLAVLATAALAAGQVKGGSYKGSLNPINDGVLVSFKVSAGGKQVTSLSISNIPIYCSGGGEPIPVHFKSTSISRNGTFTSKASNIIKIGPLKGKVGEKLKITGKFLSGGREQGTLTTTYPNNPECDGKSSYTTKV